MVVVVVCAPVAPAPGGAWRRQRQLLAPAAPACGAGLRRLPAPVEAPSPMRSSVPAIIPPSRDKVTKNTAIRGTVLCVETVGSST